ncbi:YbaB/EbfC family nucleoid-associated protein [Amycolatopsis nigrescens]|uniref:YbaB/EbfC family nucleoid-associated protein n=1 Tax=Amycolatopsis nigrescens TaxID=381445 RepID=UPI00037FC7FD|nr:YbaB/EbfC family nucleoid-associated protein [Amycolatopsis nigrescens]
MYQDLDGRRRRAEELDAELAAARHVARNDTVTAVVNGQGKLLNLSIGDAALDGPHVQSLGPDIVRAVTSARRAAAEVAAPRLAALFNGTEPPDPPRRPRPAPSRDTEPMEESFEHIDFIDGDTSNNEPEGRW